MEKYYPSYYNDFRCLAEKCPDTCCAKWEIVIDDDTLMKYSESSGQFAESIRSHLIKNEEGETCFLLKDNKCPFLCYDGLCEIHKQLGEDFTGRVCREHPRFTEEYDGFSEISLSVSCPETINILFNNRSVSYPTPVYEGDDEVLSLLIASRKEILETNQNAEIIIKTILDKAADDQLEIDLVYITDHPVFNTELINNYLSFINDSCELLTIEWKKYLENALVSEISQEEIKRFIINNESNFIRSLKYFVYRYYLKAVNDLDIYSRALFIILSCYSAVYIAVANDILFEEAIRLFSKEIEHNLINLDTVIEYLSDL